MLTERTTKKLIADSYRKCFYTDSEASDQELIWSDSAEDRLNQVWVLKEDVIKAIMRLPNDNRRYILLKELNSPPDDGIRADSVLKKDSEYKETKSSDDSLSLKSASEEDNNIYCKCRKMKMYHNCEEDSYTQEQVIHCPVKECNGMLLTSPYKHELKCSDCNKYFIINSSIEEVFK